MRTNPSLVGLLAAIWLASPAFVTASGSAATKSQESVMNYYHAPNQSRRVEVAADGRAVTICTDDCERFEIAGSADPAALWDAVVLFKAFISGTLIDDSYREANSVIAQETLRVRADSKCAQLRQPKSSASCALRTMAAQSGLNMTRIVYDEGNKCESTWSFGEPQKLLRKRCSRVKPT